MKESLMDLVRPNPDKLFPAFPPSDSDQNDHTFDLVPKRIKQRKQSGDDKLD
jgi:hypothetical protein